MSTTQRATIVALVIGILAVWGVALRGALRPAAHAERTPAASSFFPDTQTRSINATRLNHAVDRIPLVGPLTATPTRGAKPNASPTVTASRTATASPSPSATPTGQPAPLPPPAQPVDTPSIPSDGRFLLVNQDEQTMYVFEGGVEIRGIPISSGRPVANAFTPAWRGDVGRYWGSGRFLNTETWSDHMWYLFPGARGSILIHSVPYTWDGDLKIYDRPDALGVEPASHGCARISPEDAQWLESWDPVGVPIEVTPWSGEIGPPDESL